MRKPEFTIVTRLLICIGCFAMFFYLYLGRQNELTKLRLEIPVITKEIVELREENDRLQYEIDKMESPEKLMNIAKKDAFKHLEHPKEVLVIQSSVKN